MNVEILICRYFGHFGVSVPTLNKTIEKRKRKKEKEKEKKRKKEKEEERRQGSIFIPRQ